MEGAETILAWLNENIIPYDGKTCTRHLVSNYRIGIEAGGRTATAKSYVTLFHQIPGEDIKAMSGGLYRDRFEIVDGAWAFRERRIELQLLGDLSKHVRSSRTAKLDSAT